MYLLQFNCTAGYCGQTCFSGSPAVGALQNRPKYRTRLFSPYPMNGMFLLIPTVFLQFQFFLLAARLDAGSYRCAVIALTAIGTFQPYPFALRPLSHRYCYPLLICLLLFLLETPQRKSQGRTDPIGLAHHHRVTGYNISDYSMIFVTTPEPTVRPPSRIAKRTPCSSATG